MKYIKLFTLLIALIFSACSLFEDISEQSQSVFLTSSKTTITIKNNLEEKIYYNSLKKQWEPIVDWVPTQNDNFSINSKDEKSIYLPSEWRTPVYDGEVVAVYWWTDAFFENNHVLGVDGVGITNGRETVTIKL